MKNAFIILILLISTAVINADDDLKKQLRTACDNADFKTVMLILRNYNENNSNSPKDLEKFITFYDKKDVMQIASFYGNEEVVRYLMDCKISTYWGEALNFAVLGKRDNILKLFLDKYEYSNEIVAGPFFTAVRHGTLSAVSMLGEKNVDFNRRVYEEGKTPLLYAVQRGDAAIVKYLLDKGADVRIKDEFGNSAMSLAKKGKNPAILDLLQPVVETVELNESLIKNSSDGNMKNVQKNISAGASVNYIDSSGKVPLLYAVMGKHNDVIEFLLKNGADPNYLKKLNKDKLADKEEVIVFTPLAYAISTNNYDAFEMLERYGADLNKSFYCKEEFRYQFFEGGAIRGGFSMVEYTPFEFCIELNRLSIFRFILQKTEKKDDFEWVLFLACYNNSYDIVKELVSMNIDLEIDTVDNLGRTPLMIAIGESENHYDDTRLIELLLEHGASKDYLDNNGNSPEDYARNFNQSVLDLLKK